LAGDFSSILAHPLAYPGRYTNSENAFSLHCHVAASFQKRTGRLTHVRALCLPDLRSRFTRASRWPRSPTRVRGRSPGWNSRCTSSTLHRFRAQLGHQHCHCSAVASGEAGYRPEGAARARVPSAAGYFCARSTAHTERGWHDDPHPRHGGAGERDRS
jgi:hypothetical protein